MPRVPDSKFDEKKEKIPQNVENTLERVVNDYAQHWKGVIGEFIQNSYDGWCHNRFGRGNIPDDQPLHIAFEVDLAAREFKAGDNAGGMPEDVFYYNFAGLDTPGEEKQEGDFGGSYGRGAHVIAQLGEQMYAETHHDGWRGGTVIQDAHQMQSDPELEIDQQGTVVEVYDCDVETLISLTEWDRVESYIQSRFHPLLQHDNVTVEYTIDGETHVVEPLDFRDFDVLWEGDIEFEHRNESLVLEDVTIYDRTSGDRDIPINGVAMLKRNEHMDKPFMRVQDYKPRQLRHADKMFGVCDASDLCPDYEDNAHNRFIGNVTSSCGLKEKLEELERQHFIGTPTDLDEKDEIVNATLEVVNSQWDDNPFDEDNPSDLDDGPEEEADNEDDLPTDEVETVTEPDEDSDPERHSDLEDPDDDDEPEPTSVTEDEDSDGLGFPEEESGNGDGETEGDDDDDLDLEWADEDGDYDEDGGDGEADDSDDTTDEEDADDDEEDDEDEDEAEPVLTCSTRQRSFNEDDSVEIWVMVENPEESDYEEFVIEGEVEHAETEELETLPRKEMTIPPGEGSTGDQSWSFTPDKTGKYLFRAYLYETHSEPREKVDYTHTFFYVGNDTDEEEEPVQNVAFLEDVFLVRKEEDDFRAELTEGDDGMILMANTRHPEYKRAVKNDGSNGTMNQKLTLIRWSHESIMNRMLLDEIEDELSDVYTDEGEQYSNVLSDFVRDNLIEKTSELMAGAHQEV